MNDVKPIHKIKSWGDHQIIFTFHVYFTSKATADIAP